MHVLGQGYRAHLWVQKWSKIIFCKFVPRPLGVLKQVFLVRFEPMVARFDPPKFPKTFENGLFGDQKWVKIGSKTLFSKMMARPFGVHKQVK